MTDKESIISRTPGEKRQGFSKADRLLKWGEFRHTLDNGIKVVDRFWVMIGQPGAKQDRCRMGIIVSKKTGNAVTRNRIKRHVRERYRTIKSRFGGFDYVVIARRTAAEADRAEMLQSFERCLGRLQGKLTPASPAVR